MLTIYKFDNNNDYLMVYWVCNDEDGEQTQINDLVKIDDIQRYIMTTYGIPTLKAVDSGRTTGKIKPAAD